MAPGTVIVISADRIPPLCRASIDRIADSADDVRTTGTTPISRIDARICCLVIYSSLPIDHAAIVRIVTLLVAPVVPDFVRHRVLVELDPQTGRGRQIQVAFSNLERILDIPLPQRDLLLNQEVRD